LISLRREEGNKERLINYFSFLERVSSESGIFWIGFNRNLRK